MNKNKWGEILFIVLVLFGFFFFKNIFSSKPSALSYVTAGTGNPGEILIYEQKDKEIKKIKTLDTGYKFVYTVRIGDIFNNGKQNIIAGVSNSFFKEPYGCKVLSYDLKDYEETIVDDVGDLRCKDLTIGDADNDGKNEVLLTTHGEGLVRLYKWDGEQWQKEDLEKNYIAQIDRKENTNHRVPNKELTCETCTVQSAVHIVKIGDVDNDGKNEVIATISSPLELQNVEEVSFIKMYKKTADGWKNSVIDRMQDREFRSITIGDAYNKKKNVMIIGVGSPRGEKGTLYAYEYTNNQWNKFAIHNDEGEKNMKGVVMGDIYGDGKQNIVLATGFPNANVYSIEWNGKEFEKKKIGQISSLFNEKDAEFNSMVSLLRKQEGKVQLIVGGMTVFPKEKIGWEGTEKGFIVQFTQKDENTWTPTIIESRNVLGMD